MLRPSPDEVEAYWPGGVEEWHREVDEAPLDRAGVITAARAQRSEKDGLPVDDETLEHVADEVMAPGYLLPGLYLTAEEARDDVPDEIRVVADEYLGRHPGLSGGTRLGWRNGRRALFVRVVSDVEHHRRVLAALSDRVVVEAALHSEAELEGIVECIERDRDDLLAAGIDLTSWGANPNDGIVEVDIVAADADRAQRTLTSRYGPLVCVVEWSPAWRAEKPRAFGSWSAEGRMLEVFYGVGHNGEAPERCEVIDGDDEIVITVIITDMIAGIQTLVGGYRRLSAQVQLAAPLGSRRVIDGSCGEPRPSVAQLRQRHAHS